MKKAGLFAAVFFVLFSISLISSADITLTKNSYYPGATLQAEIPDIFISNLQLSNIGIYQGNSVHKSAAESGLIKSGGKYFYYAVLPTFSGDYSLRIENIKYYSSAGESSEAISKPFSIVPTNESYISVNPGHIYTSKDFSISVRAYNSPQEVTAEFEGKSQKATIPISSSKTFYFSISGIIGFTQSSVKIGSYSIPAIIISPYKSNDSSVVSNASAEEIIEDLEDLIKTDIKEINATILENKDYEFEIKISNRTNQTLNLYISSPDKAIVFDNDEIRNFKESETITATINTAEDLESKIVISNNKTEISIPVSIKITQNKSKVSQIVISEESGKTCADIKGFICNYSAGETCEGITTSIANTACCNVVCTKKQTSSSWMWGLLIIIILVLGGLWLYKKSKENPQFKIGNVFSKKTESFKERMSPEIKTGVELRKGLAKN